MRLHTDKITRADLIEATNAAYDEGQDGHVWLEMTEHGSRSRARAFEVGLEGDGTVNRRRRNPGKSVPYGTNKGYAATWDAWGRFFAYLFDIDPDMTCYAYDGRRDFHAKTDYRFVPDYGV